MPSLIDIASTALNTYRTALTITGENIANVSTEGFRRRDVLTNSVVGGQMTPTSANSGGQGVIVEDVRRAFDAFLAGQVYSTNSAVGAATTQTEIATAIEDAFLPGSGGIAGAMDDFFDSFGRLAAAPSDMALRTVALENSRSLANAISDVAQGLISLRANVVAQANIVAGEVNIALRDLADIQERMASGVQDRYGGNNAIFDQRDRQIDTISENLGINVEYDPFERAIVRLGDHKGGPTLLDIDSEAQISVKADTVMQLVITKDGTQKTTSMLTGGTLTGYARALSAVDDAISQLDAFARRITGDVNAVHVDGLDFDGLQGGDVFSLSGWMVKASALNQGSVFADISVTDPVAAQSLSGTEIVYDLGTKEWIASDPIGTELARGGSILSLNGLTLSLSGNFKNGDRLSLVETSGRAIDMRLNLTDPRQIAAASAFVVAPAPTNKGTAEMSMTSVPINPPSVPLLSDLLPISGSGADATTFLQSGAVGYIPAGTSQVELASLGRQSAADFALADAQVGAASAVTLTLDGTAYSFPTLASGAATVSDLAAFLNSDAAVAVTGETFAELGLFASGSDGALSIASGSGTLTAGSVVGVGASAAITTASAAGATISVFTRNGVQVSGPKLDQAAAAQLLTKANGFFEGARYVADFIDVNGGQGYRGMTVETSNALGQHALTSGLDAPLTWVSGQVPPKFPAHSLTVTESTGDVTTMTVPAGASAAEVAATANASLEGVSVMASTHGIFQVSGDGAVSFHLEGANIGPVAFSATVTGGRLDDVAAAINAKTGATGISASVSPDGGRLLFGNADGETITLTNFRHSAAGTASVAQSDAQGVAQSGAVTLGAGVDAVSLRGSLAFAATDALTLRIDGVTTSSGVSPFVGGLVERRTGAGGASQTLRFDFASGLDAGAASVDGLTAQAASGRYTINALGQSFVYDAAFDGAQSAEDIAKGVALALRERAPTPSLIGGVVPLPADGSETAVLLGGDVYTLRMVAGEVEVTGPEQGRLTVAFDGSGRLELSANGGTLDGAGLRVVNGTAGLAAFGLGPTSGAHSSLTGAVLDPAGLPATLRLEIDGTNFDVPISAGGASLPVGFPGTASLSPEGAVVFDFVGTPNVRIPSQASGWATGFSGLGAKVSVAGSEVTLTSLDGAVIDLSLSVETLASERLTLSDLPAEDLIVVLGGTDPLRLSGSITGGAPVADQAGVTLTVTDAANRLVDLRDAVTGDLIARQVLDTNMTARINGVEITVRGGVVTGDSFSMRPNTNGRLDGRSLEAIEALRNANPMEGRGGFAEILAALQAEKGAQVASSKTRLEAAAAMQDSAIRIYSSKGAVDLDTEAARMVEQQQAYQASAQIMTMARELFDTLINSM
ncbi:flagellin hook IN motif-containing protein [Marivivens sp. LCG002]|uniref:FlgK family flagellar hook-associated protein n=1 Tax=Marivivens sp. LCG002 TaxID=3051171 RepID=UPI0025560669|nr:flagellin hook IN motif-containing protein [Marivivens sp. LCG002]WIV51268.1 flagellin hook IN motif-containing protein [Marivivens sp. LCG002]